MQKKCLIFFLFVFINRRHVHIQYRSHDNITMVIKFKIIIRIQLILIQSRHFHHSLFIYKIHTFTCTILHNLKLIPNDTTLFDLSYPANDSCYPIKAISPSKFNKNVFLRICHFLKINFKVVNLKKIAKKCVENISSKKAVKNNELFNYVEFFQTNHAVLLMLMC